MNKMNAKIYALANMINGGKKILIIRRPDYNGGHYFVAKPYDYEAGRNEYYEWAGTPKELATQAPEFVAHIEPVHGTPEDYTMTTLEVLRYTIS